MKCQNCKQQKDTAEFYKNVVNKSGYDRFCKPCRDEMTHNYREKQKIEKYKDFFSRYNYDSVLNPLNQHIGPLFLFHLVDKRSLQEASLAFNKFFYHSWLFEEIESFLSDKKYWRMRQKVFDIKYCRNCCLNKQTYTIDTDDLDSSPEIENLENYSNEWKVDFINDKKKKKKYYPWGFTRSIRTKDGWSKFCKDCSENPFLKRKIESQTLSILETKK